MPALSARAAFAATLLLFGGAVALGQTAAPAGAGLAWAYPDAPPGPMPAIPPGTQRVPDSAKTMTVAQAQDEANPADWFPDEHPAPPAVVAHLKPGGPTPCAECHLFNGRGFIGAASLSGLSVDYIVAQVEAFRSGDRQSWQRNRADTLEMIKASHAVSDPDLKAAADYYAALPYRPWVRVVEADQAPKTKPNHYGWLDLVPGGGMEPLAGRIVEVPEDTRRMFLFDSHAGVVAYVPRGSIARGEALVKSGGEGKQPCAACHGADLKGAGDIPPLAGRAPSYLARMLWDIKTGARQGSSVDLMIAPASGLNEAQITDVAAYLASRTP